MAAAVVQLWAAKKKEPVLLSRCAKSCNVGKVITRTGYSSSWRHSYRFCSSPRNWASDPVNNTKLIAETFREACDVAADYGEKLAAEGEICWGGMHSWKTMIDTLEAVDRPNIGFQADMSHTLLYLLGYNSPQTAFFLKILTGMTGQALEEGLKKTYAALRPWTIDFHVHKMMELFMEPVLMIKQDAIVWQLIPTEN